MYFSESDVVISCFEAKRFASRYEIIIEGLAKSGNAYTGFSKVLIFPRAVKMLV